MTERAITVQAPWAQMIMTAEKLTEHRSWSVSLRGRLWIHAGLEVDPDGAHLFDPSMPRGCLLGSVTLVTVGRSGDLYHWLLRDPVALPEPIPCRGYPWLWRLPGDVLAMLPD